MRSNCVRLLRVTLLCVLLTTGCFQAVAQLKAFTVAGGAVNDGGPATAAPLTLPRFAAYDKAGNLYIADAWAHRIRKVNLSGTITTVAGNGISGFSGDGGPAKAALVSFPFGLTVDASGNILFTDSGNYRVRKIDTHGIITTIAGTGQIGYTGDGGPAIDATFGTSLYGVSADRQGRIYICDAGNNVVRRIDTAGIITTVAGNGTAGFSGDRGPATQAELNLPYVVLPDTSGNFYISDFTNDRVRKVNAQQIINTVVGNGSSGCTGDGGPATAASIGSPRGLLLNGGNLLVAGSGCSKIRTVSLTTKIINPVAGSTYGYDGDGNPFLSSRFAGESGLMLDKSGDVVTVDRANDRVRVLNNSSQLVSTIAGGYTGDGGNGTAASLNLPQGINFDGAGNLYIADTYNNRIRKLTPGGKISTFAGNGISGYSGDGGLATAANLLEPAAVAADSQGNVYFSDQYGFTLRQVNTSGIISTVPAVGFFGLYGLATDTAGNIYGADPFACVIWKITSAGTVTPIAGDSVNFQCGYNGDNIPALQALLNAPTGVALDHAGNVYIADEFNSRIRVVGTGGNITTLAGNGICGFSGDGGPAGLAMLCDPSGVVADTKGNVFIADLGNARVRQVNPSQIIQTIAGTGSFAGYNGNGLPALQTNLDAVWDIAVNPSGVVYWSDYVQYRIRKAQ